MALQPLYSDRLLSGRPRGSPGAIRRRFSSAC